MRLRATISATLVLLASQVSGAATPEVVKFSSGQSRVALIELYTSEGCSSCPPADRWLSALKDNEKLWRDVVPIAFHVDYWDYIGWRDRFADSAFTDRQRRYQQEGGTRVVYTPGFFNNGHEWRDWRYRDSRLDSSAEFAGNLTLTISGNRIDALFENVSLGQADLTVHVAVLGMNLESDVRAGENNGRKLKHDFVALSLASSPLQYSADGFKGVIEIESPISNDVQRALVAWVSSADSQAPIQAVGGYLP